MEEQTVDAVLENGEFDLRTESAGNWKGHVGHARVTDKEVVLERAWCDPSWGANQERLTLKKVENGTKIWLVPETDDGQWVKGQLLNVDFEELVARVACLGEKIQAGPTAVYNMVF